MKRYPTYAFRNSHVRRALIESRCQVADEKPNDVGIGVPVSSDGWSSEVRPLHADIPITH